MVALVSGGTSAAPGWRPVPTGKIRAATSTCCRSGADASLRLDLGDRLAGRRLARAEDPRRRGRGPAGRLPRALPDLYPGHAGLRPVPGRAHRATRVTQPRRDATPPLLATKAIPHRR